jgi:hypothetical protein
VVGVGLSLKNHTGKYWYIYNGGTGSWVGDGALGFVYTDGTNAATGPKVTFNSAGNVGIGTSGPLEGITFGSSNSIIARSSATDFNSGYCSRILFNQGGTGYGYLGFYTYEGGSGGGERVRISESGNVGIGTTSATSKLTILQSSGADSVLLELQSNNDPGIRFGRSTYGSLIRHVSATTDYIAFNCNGSSKPSVSATAQVVFNENGNVGIGTDNPTSKLHVVGNAQLYGTNGGNININTAASGNGDISFDGSTFTIVSNSSSASLVLSTNSTERFRITSGGNVGIGTSSASRKLIVYGDSAFATNSGGLVIASYDSDTANIRPSVANGSVLISDDSNLLTRGTEFLNGGGIIVQSLSGFTPLEVKSNSSTLLFVASGGNVGIGTTSPSYKLDVNSASASFALRLLGSSVDGPVIRLENTASGGRIYHVGSTATGSGAGTGFSIYDVTGSGARMLIDANGNVGIGTTSPADKLEVSGTTRTDKLRSNGIVYLGITGTKSSNASAFNMFDINNTGSHQTIEIILSHHHSGGGQHGSFRRVILALNAYTDLIVLEDVSTNFGGGLGFTVTRTSASTIRIGWAGATAYATGYTFIGWIKGNGDYSVTNVAMDSLDAA